MSRWTLPLLLAGTLPGCKKDERPATTVVPSEAVAKAPAQPAAPPPPPQPAQAADPLDGKFSLEDATQGLPGKGSLQAILEVDSSGQPLGTFHCDLYADKAPLTVANFVGLARGLRPFRDPRSGEWVKRPLYDGMHFHRVIPEFMVQTGDPNCQGDASCRGQGGTGDPGYRFADEVEGGPRMNEGGLLAMANRGPGTNGSQFFITEKAAPWLTGRHTIFGRCAEVDLVQKITAVPRGVRDAPKEPVVIKKVTIRRK